MKIIFLALMVVSASGCVEFHCYSNLERAEKKADEFCSRGNGDEKLCESLEIDGKVCRVSPLDRDLCVAHGRGIRAFIAIPYHQCTKYDADAERCRSEPSCSWTFVDPIGRKYYHERDQ